MIFDLGNMLVNLWAAWRKDKEFQDWIRLLLSCHFSGFIAFTGAWGGALMVGKAPWFAFGSGLVACAVAIFTVLLRMKQGRSLMIVVPTQVEQSYESAGQTVVNPVEKK